MKKIREERNCETLLFPKCVSNTTYGVTQFWAEEYWTWLQIQKIRKKYPFIDLSGLVNREFENHLNELLINKPHNKILDTNSFTEVPKDSWVISNNMLTIATSHAPSRYKAQRLLRRYKEKCRILTIDAHYDLGNYSGIHGAWITDKLARHTCVIGGWDETLYELKAAQSFIPYIESSLTILSENNSFLRWIADKKVYISIDLDFFPPAAEYYGLSSFWNRNLFIGHSLNLNQQIQMLGENIDLATPTLIGKTINLFENLSSFRKEKIISINSHLRMLMNLIEEIVILFQNTSSSLLGMDLVEYSAICDWDHLTINALMKHFNLFKSALQPIIEK